MEYVVFFLLAITCCVVPWLVFEIMGLIRKIKELKDERRITEYPPYYAEVDYFNAILLSEKFFTPHEEWTPPLVKVLKATSSGTNPRSFKFEVEMVNGTIVTLYHNKLFKKVSEEDWIVYRLEN